MTIVGAAELPDFKAAPNQGGHVELYEAENKALDPDGLVLAAMRARAPWAGRTLLDLGSSQWTCFRRVRAVSARMNASRRSVFASPG